MQNIFESLEAASWPSYHVKDQNKHTHIRECVFYFNIFFSLPEAVSWPQFPATRRLKSGTLSVQSACTRSSSTRTPCGDARGTHVATSWPRAPWITRPKSGILTGMYEKVKGR